MIRYNNKYGKGKFNFVLSSDMGEYRARSFFTKEPWTIDWILELEEDDVFWDVGANLGVYTLWAAHKTKCKNIYAFEPSYLNYPTLCENIIKNNFKQVEAYCLALSDNNSFSRVKIPSKEIGASGVSVSNNGSQSIMTYTGDHLISMGLKSPTFIKLDVDGLEPLIINGLENALKNTVKTILVELDQRNSKHMQTLYNLRKLGFEYDVSLLEKNWELRKNGNWAAFAEFILRKC